jgi:hypothetical protein
VTIDIDRFTGAELIDLNNRIVERLRLLVVALAERPPRTRLISATTPRGEYP